MRINSVYLENFENVKIDFPDGLAVFVGNNGSGKTAVLECGCRGIRRIFKRF